MKTRLNSASFLLFLIVALVYLANGRSIGAGDTLPARYLPFSLLREHDFKSEKEKLDIIKIDPPPISKALKKRWSYFIRKVYETDPLTCPKCHVFHDEHLLPGNHDTPLLLISWSINPKRRLF